GIRRPRHGGEDRRRGRVEELRLPRPDPRSRAKSGIPGKVVFGFQCSVFSDEGLEFVAYQSFEELDVWKRACNLAVQVYESLRDCREYGLRDQMQRAAVSIASNIAEGSERTPKDFARFLTMARGSAAELRTQT